ERVARLELDRRDGVREPPEDAPPPAEEVVEPGRAVHRQRHITAAQRERLEHAREPEVVVRMEVRQEDLLELDEPDIAAQELTLRALSAIEQETLATSPDE